MSRIREGVVRLMQVSVASAAMTLTWGVIGVTVGIEMYAVYGDFFSTAFAVMVFGVLSMVVLKTMGEDTMRWFLLGIGITFIHTVLEPFLDYYVLEPLVGSEMLSESEEW